MKRNKIIIQIIIVIIVSFMNLSVFAHGGNISGWKNKTSEKIIKYKNEYFGYHKQDGKLHYHKVEWNEEKQRWDIINSAVYYDEDFNITNNLDTEKTEKITVDFLEKVDGDTAKFKLNNENITVRFLGIDTPETVHPNKGEELFGKEASDFTEEKLKNATKIELEYDSNSDKTDKYERHLAWIWVDDQLLQEELIKNGLANTYMLQNNYRYAGKLQLAQQEAKNLKLGIWSQENNNNEEINKIENEEVLQEEDNNLEKVFLSVIFVIGLILKILKKKK